MIESDLAGNFPNSSLAAVLNTGLRVIDQDQVIEFVAYRRVILPFDGYVFWYKDATIEPITISGSLHYQTDQKQELDKTHSYQNVVFTTSVEVQHFNDIQPDTLWLGQWADFEFGFSSHANRYEQAGLWHYLGQAVYPEMRTQIIESANDLPPTPVVSNSLPVWLALSDFGPVYPSFLIPENLTPPYIVCDIQEKDTTAIQPIAAQVCGRTYQLMQDRIRLISYGLINQDVQNYIQYIIQSSLSGSFGIMQSGIRVSDGKRIQSEMNVIAQQKFIELDVSYNQSAVFDIAVKYIKKVLPVSLIPNL